MNKTKHIFGIGVIAAVAAMAASCNNYDFDQEFYRNDVSLLQASNGIYARTTVDLKAAEQGTATIPLTILVAGSQPSDHDCVVELEPSDSLFNRYNKTNYDVDSTKFAKLLPGYCYDQPNLTVTIPAGEEKAIVNIPVRNLDSLSPDSTYFLEYKIKSSTNGINNKKDHVLLRVHWKNDYTATSDLADYTYSSTQIIYNNASGPVTERPTVSITAFPLSSNKIRFVAGQENYSDYSTAEDWINTHSMVYIIGNQTETNPDAYNVDFESYKPGEVEIQKLNPIDEFDNTYRINSVGGSAATTATYYKEFRLHYRYRITKNSSSTNKEGETTYTAGPWKEVKAILRYSFNPRADLL